MTLNWKKASVGTSLALAVLALSGYAYTRAHAAPTFRLDNGVEITQSSVPQDDTARLLESQSWKFKVQLPNDHKQYYCSLSLACPNKPQQVLGSYNIGGMVHTDPIELDVGLMPLYSMASRTYSEASKYKYSFFYKYSDGSSSGSYGFFANPFVGEDVNINSGPSREEDVYFRAGDNVFLLRGHRHPLNDANLNNPTLLIFRVSTDIPK